MTQQRDVNWSVLALLRFFLACIVLAGHMMLPSATGQYLGVWGGKAAVVGFMMVSGFSIAASIASRPEGFLMRRVLRIYPMYLGAVVMTVLVQESFRSSVNIEWRTFEQDGLGVVIGNVLMVQMFLCKALSFNGPLWSISLEMFYYFLAPFLNKLPRKFFIPLMLLSAVVFLLPKHPELGRAYQLLTSFNALRYVWSWMLGFWLYKNQNSVSAIAGVALPVLVFPWSAEYTGSVNLLTLVLSTMCLLHSPRIGFSKLPNGFLGLLGDISYPLYLTHYPLRILLISGFGWTNDFLFYALSLILAYAFLIVFDNWFKRILVSPLVARLFQTKPVRWTVNFIEST